MLYGGVAWSELSISTQPQSVPNGTEEEFSGVIVISLEEELVIDSERAFEITVSTKSELDILINSVKLETLLIKTEAQFDLDRI